MTHLEQATNKMELITSLSNQVGHLGGRYQASDGGKFPRLVSSRMSKAAEISVTIIVLQIHIRCCVAVHVQHSIEKGRGGGGGEMSERRQTKRTRTTRPHTYLSTLTQCVSERKGIQRHSFMYLFYLLAKLRKESLSTNHNCSIFILVDIWVMLVQINIILLTE